MYPCGVVILILHRIQLMSLRILAIHQSETLGLRLKMRKQIPLVIVLVLVLLSLFLAFCLGLYKI